MASSHRRHLPWAVPAKGGHLPIQKEGIRRPSFGSMKPGTGKEYPQNSGGEGLKHSASLETIIDGKKPHEEMVVT